VEEIKKAGVKMLRDKEWREEDGVSKLSPELELSLLLVCQC